MSTTHAKELKKIQKIIYRGEYNKALDKLNLLVEDPGLTDEDSVLSRIVLSRVLKLVNQHILALKYLEKLLKKKLVKKNPLLKIEVLILKSDILLLSGKENVALPIINEVDDMIEEYKKENKNSEIKRLEAYHNFVKGTAFLKRGHTKEAIDQMNISLELWKEIDNKQEIARVSRNIGKCHIDRGEFDVAIKILKESYKTSMSIKNMMDSIHPLGYIAEIYYKKGEIEKTIEHYKIRLELSEKAKFTYGIMSSNFFIGFCYCAKGELDKAKEYLTVSMKMAKKEKHYRMLGLSLGAFGIYYKLAGELEKAIKYYNESIEAFEKIDSKHKVAENLNNIGEIHLLRGEPAKALEIFKRSLLIFEEVGRSDWIINTQRNIGDVYAILGDLEEALVYYFKALNYYTRRSIQIQISQCMYNIGGIFWRKGDTEDAKTYLDKSLEIVKDFGSDVIAAKILLDLVEINLESFETEVAYNYYEKLLEIKKKLDNKLVNQQSRLAEALIYKQSEHKREQGKAEKILEELIGEDIIHYSLTINALLNLCESYLDNFKETFDNKILVDLDQLIDKLLNIAEEQKAVSLLAETYWLKYQLLIIDETKEEEAEAFMQKADQIARDYELTNLVNKFALQKNLIQLSSEDIQRRIEADEPPIDRKYNQWERVMDQIKVLKDDGKSGTSRPISVYDKSDREIFVFKI